MTASIRTELVEDARQLVLAVTGAPDAKVIVAGDKAPKSGKPYITVRMTTVGLGRGRAERIDGVDDPDNYDDATPTTILRERREAVVSLQGYGSGAALWLDRMQIGIDSPESLAAQAERNISARVQSPVTELSALLDTGEEQRFSLELRFGYLYATDPTEQVAADHIQVETELRRSDDDPDMLSADQTVDRTG